jgi:hypothetical protein
MAHSDPHLSDQDLILLADGELSQPQPARAHLDSCWRCRTRQRDLESAVSDYMHLHRELDATLPPAAAPRALLRARLFEAGQHTGTDHSFPVPWRWSLAAGFIAVFLAGLALYLQTTLRAAPVPISRLTPGETRTVTLDDVCRLPGATRPQTIPATLQRQVFSEYGIPNAGPGTYEVDYLITPELGGADSIRNLWPQPYSALWNARVKDRLEDRLHNLVCEGKVDLATAQREIATDWISAYKKYFGTNRPD